MAEVLTLFPDPAPGTTRQAVAFSGRAVNRLQERHDAMEQNAERGAASSQAAATMTTSGGTGSRPAPPIARGEPQTTGSRPQHDPREDEQLERDR